MKISKLYLFWFLLWALIFNAKLQAQNETNNWYFGKHAALSFSSSPPTVLYNSNMSALEGCASISDASGNLLFYSNGDTIWNKNHTIMANGTGLFGNLSSTQAVLIAKLPGSNSIYYVFTTNPLGTSIGLRYSKLDMNLAAGLGSVTVKNTLLYTPTCEKLVGVKHCNGKDTWIISRETNLNGFRAYLLNSNGISLNPIFSNVGGNINNLSNSVGYLKASSNGSKLCASYWGSTSILGWAEVYDFDNSTGIISNPLNLGTYGFNYGCEFSPDGSKLFAATFGTPQVLMQWDLCAGSNSAIVNSKYTISTGSVFPTNAIYGMQLAKDGKIYFCYGGASNIGVIHNPNNLGAAMGLSLSALSVAPNSVMLGLPNFVNNYNAVQMPLPFSNSLACSTVSFFASSQPSQTVAATCTTLAYPTNSYLWDFGDPNSAAANTSSLANPVHYYSAIGNYTVSLILNSQCRTDTLVQSINITALSPTFSVSGPTAICKGETATFSASPAYSYSWTNGSLSGSMAVTPTVGANYMVIATASNGCKWSKNIVLTVNKCLGENLFTQNNSELLIYPNPSDGEFTFESFTVSQLFIYNTLGDLVFETKIQKGENKINLNHLNNGLYLANVLNENKFSVYKIIKKE
jgi:hypothetical protein